MHARLWENATTNYPWAVQTLTDHGEREGDHSSTVPAEQCVHEA